MKTFKLEIITPEQSFPSRDIVAVDVPAAEGRLTVLPGHAPLVCTLTAGNVSLRNTDDTKETLSIGSGTMTVNKAVVTLLVRKATAPS